MIRSISLLLLSYFALGSAANCASGGNATGTKYLHVTLWDSFGDGWQNAWWMMSDPGSDVFKEQSDCWEIKKEFDVHPCDHTPPNGLYYMIVQTPDETLPEGWWEIYWKVEVFYNNGTSTGYYYEGVYNTTMVWEYDLIGDRWTLVHYDGLPDFNCTDCTDSQCVPKPDPKPKPKAKDSKKGPIKGKGDSRGKGKGRGGGSDGDSSDSSDSSNSTSTYNNSTNPYTNSTDGEERYGPRAVPLSVKMMSEHCDGWGNLTHFPLGAAWYIMDTTKTELFDQGSLCAPDACEGLCNICLGDGSYVFRVTGPTFNESIEDAWWNKTLGYIPGDEPDHSILDKYRFISWEFCHARGGYNDQLNFHVLKGKCIPDDLRWADEICDDLENSTVTLYGLIALSGLHSEALTSLEYEAILSVLAGTVEGWTLSKMTVLGSSIDTRVLTSGHRGLNTFTHDVEFQVVFTAEDFGIDGATYAAVQSLVSDMSSTVDAAFSSGAFSSMLASNGAIVGLSALNEVNGELLALDISKISYSHNHLVYVYDEDLSTTEVSSSSSWDGQTKVIAIVAIAGVAVFAAFVGVMAHTFRREYKQVSTVSDSAHNSISFHEDLEGVNPFSTGDITQQPKRMVFPTRRV